MRLRDFLTPPVFSEEEKTRKAWVLHIILWTSIVGVTLMELVDLISLPENRLRWVAVIVFIDSINLFLLFQNRRGRVRMASSLYIFSMWTLVTILIATEGVLHAPEASAYLLIVFAAGLLLGTGAGIFTGIACTITTLIFVWLEYMGHFFPRKVPHTTFTFWYTQAFYTALIISLQWLANKSIKDSLLQARHELAERKRAEEFLRENEKRFRIVVEQTGQLVYDLDVATGQLQWLGAVERLTGFSMAEFQEVNFQQWKDMIHPTERARVIRLFEKAQETIGIFEAEYQFRYKNDEYIYVHDHGIFLSNDSGKAYRMLGTMSDITSRKKAEEENLEWTHTLEQRVHERTVELETSNKELNTFSYSVSHDLRAPLRAIQGFSEILEEDHGAQLPAEAKQLLHSIRNNARRMGQLIDDILTLSKAGRQPLNKSRLDLQKLATEVAEELRRQEKQREIKLTIGALPDRLGDPSLIRQVFVNLLSNAFKFTRERHPAEIEVNTQQRDGEEVYFVRDNGAGFNMEQAAKLFAPFERLHSSKDFEGTGIGLSIVERIIQRHGGRIWAEGKAGQGATFYFTLPKN